MIKANISNIVEKISKNVDFMQPVYETIINSLEANSSNIEIEFFADNDDISNSEYKHVKGFAITDDGDGFTEDNIDSFNELWTKHKIRLGCKGSGRFTWLSVFKNIYIISKLKDSNKVVKIPFSLTYDKEIIDKLEEPIQSNCTKITFSDVDKRFFRLNKQNKIIDERELADINLLYDKIFDYLLIRLFLFKMKSKNFNIKIKLDDKTKIITNETVPNLNSFDFNVKCSVPTLDEKEFYVFKVFYLFKEDNNKKYQLHLCSNSRPSESFEKSLVGISGDLPNNESFTLLVTSEYLDDKDGDDRNGLVELSHLKNSSAKYPILKGDIFEALKPKLSNLLLGRYKKLDELNKKAVSNAISKTPFLTKYIESNTDSVKSENALISNAIKEFSSEKTTTKEKFENLLMKKEIDPVEFSKQVGKVSDIAKNELGEYIFYRSQLIKALIKAIDDKSKKEKFVHNIFMPKGTDNSNSSKIYLSNFWLLDDKYMNFMYASSDLTNNTISDKLKNYLYDKETGNKRPDIFISYNKEQKSDYLDAILIEFKGFNAKTKDKLYGSDELFDNIAAVRNQNKNIDKIYAYVITDVDDDMLRMLKNDDGYQQLFTNKDDGICFYRYNKNIKAHIYVLDIKALCNDAKTRNDVFLNILENK